MPVSYSRLQPRPKVLLLFGTYICQKGSPPKNLSPAVLLSYTPTAAQPQTQPLNHQLVLAKLDDRIFPIKISLASFRSNSWTPFAKYTRCSLPYSTTVPRDAILQRCLRNAIFTEVYRRRDAFVHSIANCCDPFRIHSRASAGSSTFRPIFLVAFATPLRPSPPTARLLPPYTI